MDTPLEVLKKGTPLALWSGGHKESPQIALTLSGHLTSRGQYPPAMHLRQGPFGGASGCLVQGRAAKSRMAPGMLPVQLFARTEENRNEIF